MSDKRIDGLITQVTEGLAGLAAIMADPASVDFHAHRASFEALEKGVAAKAAVDASFAWLAELNGAGRLVGATDALEYLVSQLGVSRSEALNRLRQGRALFDPVPEPEPEPPSPSESAAEREVREAEARRRAAAEEEAQREARRRDASAEKRRVIEAELRRLFEHAVPGANELRAQALAEAEKRSVEDLRAWVRQAVLTANRATRKPDGRKDPLAVFKKRELNIHHQRADGMVVATMLLTPADAALLKATSLEREQGGAAEPDATDKRSMAQKRYDTVMDVIRNHAGERSHRRGAGSVVVSLTLSELENMDEDSRFQTSTGVELSPIDLLSLGQAKFDWVTIEDDRTHRLWVGRGQRTATLEQRIALLVKELVCSHPGCDRCIDECQVHHIIAWLLSGRTDIENLTLLCWRHHKNNNDRRDGSGNMGHAERDPETGRVGHRAAGAKTVRLNDSVAASKAASAKLRA